MTAGFAAYWVSAWRYGARSLVRHPRRAALTLATIALSTGVSILAHGFKQAAMGLWKDGIVEYGTGHATLKATPEINGLSSLDAAALIEPTGPEAEALGRDVRVVATSDRLKLTGLIAANGRSLYFVGEAFDPARERLVSPRLFTPGAITGSFLRPDHLFGVVLGARLAATLGVKAGDSATMIAPTAAGQTNSYDVEIVGVLEHPVLELSRRLVYMDIALARRLIGVDVAVTERAFRLRDVSELAAFVADHRAGIQKEQLSLLAWWDVWPFVLRLEDLLGGVVLLIGALLFASAALAVLNVVLVSVEERMVELGTLMALGARGRDVLALLSVEAGLVGFVGGALGALLGNGALTFLGWVGVPFDNPFGAGTVIIQPKAVPLESALVGLAAIVVCLVAAALPAHKASRIAPASAFRRVAT